jgi:hypothetical protein
MNPANPPINPVERDRIVFAREHALPYVRQGQCSSVELPGLKLTRKRLRELQQRMLRLNKIPQHVKQQCVAHRLAS